MSVGLPQRACARLGDVDRSSVNAGGVTAANVPQAAMNVGRSASANNTN